MNKKCNLAIIINIISSPAQSNPRMSHSFRVEPTRHNFSNLWSKSKVVTVFLSFFLGHLDIFFMTTHSFIQTKLLQIWTTLSNELRCAMNPHNEGEIVSFFRFASGLISSLSWVASPLLRGWLPLSPKLVNVKAKWAIVWNAFTNGNKRERYSSS